MEDGGQTLRELVEAERDLSRWRDVLPLYAGVQIDLDGRRAPSCSRSACPTSGSRRCRKARGAARRDRRTSPTRSGDGSSARCPGFGRACEELAAAGIPETIQHDDLHDSQVFVRDGRYLLLDWGDSCISHPFFSLAVTLDGVIAWGVDDVQGSEPTEPYRDAYLEPFRAVRRGDLVALAQTARRLGWLCRALNSRLSQPSDESTRLRLRMFLDGRA